MKPIRLEINGINSYSKKQIIDFEQLTSRGLFGIFGNTGSGKSTILDAITLSLYGNISRSSKDFINSNLQKALVDFEFELGMGQDRKYYKITRRFKKKETKDKISSVSDSVRLMIKDFNGQYQVIADKVGEVNSSIKTILGLEEGDFLKSVLLPQGKFSEFLSLGGKERRNMLERIFGLEEYGTSLSLKLAREKKYLEGNITSINAIMTQHDNISKEALEELNNDLKKVIEKKENTIGICDILKKRVEDLKELEKNLKELKKIEEENKILMEKDNNIILLEKKVESSISIASIISDLSEYRATKNDIDIARAEIKKNKISISKLENSKDLLIAKIKNLDDKLVEIDSKMLKTESIETLDNDMLDDLNSDVNSKKVKLQKLIQDKKIIDDTKNEENDISHKILYIKNLIDKDKKELELEQARLKDFEKLNRKASIKSMVDEIKKEWIKSEGRDKNICPLCGSNIVDTGGIFNILENNEDENTYQKNLEKNKKNCEELSHSISKNTGLLESYYSRRDNIRASIEQVSRETHDVDIENYQKEISDLEIYVRDQRKLVETKNNTYMNLMKEKSKTEQDISEYKLEATKIIGDIGSKSEINNRYEESIEEKTSKLDELYSYVNSRIVELSLSSLIGDIDNIDIIKLKKDYTDLDKIRLMKLEIEEHQNNKTKLKTKLSDIKSKIGEKKLDKEELKEKENEYNEFIGELESLKEKETGLYIKIKDTQERLLLVNKLKKELKEYSLKMDDIKDLEKILKGNRFVEYLSQIYLKNIVVDASKRLDWITSGRYAIEINSDYMFVIRDNFNGGIRRSADTLSGGETFLVSLALALALSSQIQLKGSAPLEFFFLDEGFGSLDSELLDLVMTSLEKLHSKNLSVGIISHVEELKSRVPMKLMVNLDEKEATSKCKIELS